MNAAPGWWLYYRLIPSAVSVLLVSVMMMYIFATRSTIRKERSYYSQLSVIYGVADIIQSVSWFIGPKYHLSYVTCAIQQHMFEFGSLVKAMTMVVISWSIFYIIKRMKPFDLTDPEIKYYMLVLGAFAVLSLLMCVAFRTNVMFCNDDDEASLSHANTAQRAVYMLVYVIPIYIMYAFNLVTTGVTFKYIMKLDSEISATSRMLRPLLPYPFIFTCALVPAGINLGFHLTNSGRPQILEDMSGLGISLCGIFYVFAFFYFQRVEWKSNMLRSSKKYLETPLTSSSGASHIMRNEANLLRADNVNKKDSSSNSEAFFTLPFDSQYEPSSSSVDVFNRHSEF